ncbi:hypothetical protein ATK36_0658 [Amycolatopsis sulphurea]|uniref:Uncharacterized protein n=1 Tax=Amycolatopsis sulphurea TaxID=76022 RepID=A0A2A9G2R9_9PSEU|nr:hypothetical protein ATK36_0658 [Amycolatopsis sulphurea]
MSAVHSVSGAPSTNRSAHGGDSVKLPNDEPYPADQVAEGVHGPEV